MFVAPAIGAALATSRFVDRGEARAVFALGASPRSLIAHAWPLWFVFFTLSVAASLAWGKQAEAPGKLIQALLNDGRVACEKAAETNPAIAHAATVPLASATWICLPNEPARVVFDLGALGDVVAAAGSIELSADTTSLAANDLDVVIPETNDRPEQTLHVDRARLSGLLPLGRPSNLQALVRGVLLGATSCLSAIVTSFSVLIVSIRSRAIALAIGLAGPASALLVFSDLERAPTRLFAYALVPLLALLSPVLVASVANRVSRRMASGPA